jgi:hypothetical protein
MWGSRRHQFEQLWDGSQAETTKAKDIVGIRYQATTGEDTADWEDLSCAIVNRKVSELAWAL